ncbi:glycosyltransferase family 9 protein [Paenarthrobacter sp. Z7-10]|uniref:glycosyltransferase family 9 protein n=1 Tax=Paenarthrobacter sp. Z7-10 TaxID=2787635 RepID=UPI0022A8F635|nr:glycosyltransferase family 9 protein [Paenarthrobacter sp. Z7-10]MCZ2403796.1 glycosyltransferase family 9 protein [Paenarthrobacter sp. Z7-10]
MVDPQSQPVLLALRTLKLGDFLVAVPALRALKSAFPEHRLVYAAPGWLAPIVSLLPEVDELLPTAGLDQQLHVDPGSVDIAVNLHGSGPESRGRLELLQPHRRIGHKAPGWTGPDWKDGIHERQRWARLLQWHSIPADPEDLHLQQPDPASPFRGASIVHVGAFYGSRRWPVDRFAAVAAQLAERGHRVLLTGSAAERPRAEAVGRLAGFDGSEVVAGALSLGDFAAAVAAARLVVSADTGAAHLASAFRIPSVVLFGPAPPQEWGPPPGPHIVLSNQALRRGDTFGDAADPAMLAVQPDDVLRALQRLGQLQPEH